MFSSAVSDGTRWKNWKTKPIFSPRSRASRSSSSAVMSVPSMRIWPLDGESSPAISPSSVDLPLPDGPMIARHCPAGTVIVSGCRMVSGWPPLETVLLTPRSSIIVR